MSHRDREKARALEYARGQGWLPPEELPTRVHDGQETVRGSLDGAILRIADLEEQLRVSHAAAVQLNVALKKSSPVLRARVAALEGALRALVEAVLLDSAVTGASDVSELGPHEGVAIFNAREVLGS